MAKDSSDQRAIEHIAAARRSLIIASDELTSAMDAKSGWNVADLHELDGVKQLLAHAEEALGRVKVTR